MIVGPRVVLARRLVVLRFCCCCACRSVLLPVLLNATLDFCGR